MKVYPEQLKSFLPHLDWTAEQLATNLSMIGHESEVAGTALEVKIFPNRGDVLSLRGLARDLAALYPDAGEWHDVETTPLPAPKEFYPLTIKPDANKFVWADHLLKIEGYQPTKSPEEVTALLKSLSLQPKDLLVDLTNVVTYELGLPLHAFDFDKVAAGMSIELSDEGDRFTALNGKSVSLPKGLLIARQTDGSVADLLGIIGGANSAVETSSTTILLQAISLDNKIVRTNSRASAIKTEASYRYERGVDPELADKALGRLVYYLQKYAPKAKITAYQRYTNHPVKKRVQVSPVATARLLGTEVSQKNINDLARLGFTVSTDSVGVPSWRFDIENPADITEEVARLIGLNKIKPQALSKEKPVPDKMFSRVLGLKHQLCQLGYSETLTYSFVPEGPVTLHNPRTRDHRAMRSSLQNGLVATLAKNPFLPKAKFFEIGKVFLPDETLFVGVVLSGIKDKHLVEREAELKKMFGAEVKLKRIEQETLDHVDIKQKNVFWFELPLSSVTMPATYDYRDQTLLPYRKISKFPPIVRDVTLLVEDDLDPSIILETVRDNNAVLVAELVDRYSADSLGPHKVTLTFRLFFQNLERSLTDEEANELQANIFQRLEDRVKFEIR